MPTFTVTIKRYEYAMKHGEYIDAYELEKHITEVKERLCYLLKEVNELSKRKIIYYVVPGTLAGFNDKVKELEMLEKHLVDILQYVNSTKKAATNV